MPQYKKEKKQTKINLRPFSIQFVLEETKPKEKNEKKKSSTLY